MNKTITLKTVSLIFVLCFLHGIAYGQEQTAKEEEIRLLKERLEELENKVKSSEPLRNKSEQSEINSKFDSLYQKYKNRYTLMKGKYIGPIDFGLSFAKTLEQPRCQDLTRWAVGEYGTIRNWRVVQIVASDEILALGEGTNTEAKLVHLSGWATKDLLDGQEWHGDVYDNNSHSFGANIAIVGTYIYATTDGASNTILDAVPLKFFQKGLTKKQFEAMLKSGYELPSDLMELKIELASRLTSTESRLQVAPLDKESTQKPIDSQFESLYEKYKNRYVLLKGEYWGPFDFLLSGVNELAQENMTALTSWAIGQKGVVKRWQIVQISGPEEMLAVGYGGDAGSQLINLRGWSTAQLLKGQDWYGDNADDNTKGYIGANIAIVGTYTYTTISGASNTILKAIPLKLFRQGLTKKQFLDMLKARYDLPPELMDLKSKLQSKSFSIKSVEDDTAYDSRVEVVTKALLPDYEQTTIGDAFNAFFATPKWEFKVASNGIKYVIFSGRLKTPVQIESNTVVGRRYLPQTILKGTLITFKFVMKPSTYRKFEIYSVDVEEDGYGRKLDMGDRQIDSLIEAIYTLDIDKIPTSEKKKLETVNKTIEASKEECPEYGKKYYDNFLSDREREDLPFDKYVKAIKDYKKRTGRNDLNAYDYRDIVDDARLIPIAKSFYQQEFSANLKIDIPLEEFILAVKEYRERIGQTLSYSHLIPVKSKIASNHWWWFIKYLYENEVLTDDMNQPMTWEDFADALENYRRTEKTSVRTFSSQEEFFDYQRTKGKSIKENQLQDTTENSQQTGGMSIEELIREIGLRKERMFEIIKPNIKKYLAKEGDWQMRANGYYNNYTSEEFRKKISFQDFAKAIEDYRNTKGVPMQYRTEEEKKEIPKLHITDFAKVRGDLWKKEFEKKNNL